METLSYTFAELEVSESTFEEIFGLLEAAEYQHAFMAGHKGKTTLIDMQGITLKRKEKPVPPAGRILGEGEKPGKR